MRKLILVMLLLSFSLLPLCAQTESGDGGADSPRKWTLQLKMPALISASPASDGEIGSIYLLRGVSRHSALRTGLSLAFLTNTDESLFLPEGRTSDIKGIIIHDIPTSVKALTLHVHYLGYMPTGGAATLYFGAGPLFLTSRIHAESNPYQWVTRTTWSLGVEGVVGVLVRLKSRLALFAEYNFWYADKFGERKFSNDGEVRTWMRSMKVRQTIPASTIPLVGVSFGFE